MIQSCGSLLCEEITSKATKIIGKENETGCISEMCKRASVQGQERRVKPPLKSIWVGSPFECIGMDFLPDGH